MNIIFGMAWLKLSNQALFSVSKPFAQVPANVEVAHESLISGLEFACMIWFSFLSSQILSFYLLLHFNKVFQVVLHDEVKFVAVLAKFELDKKLQLKFFLPWSDVHSIHALIRINIEPMLPKRVFTLQIKTLWLVNHTLTFIIHKAGKHLMLLFYILNWIHIVRD